MAAACRMGNQKLFGGEGGGGAGNHSAAREGLSVQDTACAGRGFEATKGKESPGQES